MKLLRWILPALCALGAALPAHPEPARALRVCADPDRWPQSHRERGGFELEIAEALARQLGARLETHWIVMEGRVVGATLGARACDVLLGVPSGLARTATTRPYYRSSFVWIERADAPALRRLDDPRLATLRVGVPRVRLDKTATPAALVLHERGLGERLVGFDAEDRHMPAALAAAVLQQQVDVGILWGPLAGWHVARAGGRLRMQPIETGPAHRHLPVQIDMALAVRPADRALLAELEAALDQAQPQLDAILERFAVPRVGPAR